MKKVHLVLIGITLSLIAFVMNNYLIWYSFDVMYEALEMEKTSALGISADLTISMFGAVLAGTVCAGLFWILAGWLSRLTKDRKKWKPRIFCILAALPLFSVLSKGELNALFIPREEAIRNIRESGVSEKIGSQTRLIDLNLLTNKTWILTAESSSWAGASDVSNVYYSKTFYPNGTGVEKMDYPSGGKRPSEANAARQTFTYTTEGSTLVIKQDDGYVLREEVKRLSKSVMETQITKMGTSRTWTAR